MTPSTEPTNEDPEIDPEEIIRASEEAPAETPPAEVNSATAELTAWDEAPASAGSAAPKVLPEDAVPAAELLIDEGLAEADRQQRLAAVDPDFEP